MERLARAITRWAGTTTATVAAFAFVLSWIAYGLVRRPGFDDSYQLWLNTPTTALTFLMVFLIQRANNSDTRALHVKLDELLCALEEPRSELAGVEQRGEQAITEARRA